MTPADDPVRACAACGRDTVKILARGLCWRCYMIHQQAGTLPPVLHQTGIERVQTWLASVSDLGPEPCWPWPGAKTQGYGQIRPRKRSILVHRLAYELLVGPIPAGLHIDHLCHNRTLICSDDARCPHRSCANPAHLEAVTPRVNTVRGHTIVAANLAKTHCPQGHQYDGENLYVVQKTGSRQCRECKRATDRRAYWRARGVAS